MIEVCKGTNLSVFLQRIKQKEEMENKKPIVLNNLEEWDFTDYIDSLIQKEEAVDLEFKIAKDGLPNSLWDTYSSFANTNGGAKKVLIPITSAADFGMVPADILNAVQPLFYSIAEEAVFRALGVD